jgi:small subunit ribosomal protein S1
MRMEENRPDTENTENHENDAEETEDFAALLESSEFGTRGTRSRDAKIEGTVVSITDDWVFLDIGGKSEGAISREELTDRGGALTVNIGDTLSAWMVNSQGGETILSVKMTAAASDEAIRMARENGVPVEGLVQGERKGGFTIALFGKQAFCPFSQIDLQPNTNSADHIGQRYSFRIIEYSDRGRNIVLSRRAILEEERRDRIEELKTELHAGDERDGIVKRIAAFGAFVDIGGVEGLVPLSEMAWYRVGSASEVLTEGQQVRVKILDLNWDANRISLSIKQMLQDPWDRVKELYPVERTLSGTVTKLMNFGAFVELEPGVEGLIHISNLGGGRRVNHPREVVSESQGVEVKVISVDPQARRIGLELIVTPVAGSDDEPAVELKQGDVVEATVDALKDYGVFFTLPGGRNGLLHISEIAGGKSGDLRSRFPVGSTQHVQILAIDPETRKISLSTKSLAQSEETTQFKDFVKTKGGPGASAFGKFGDILKDKLKK